MAELFTLVGKISIDATLANQTINGTMELVGQLEGNMRGMGTQANSAARAIDKNSKFGTAMLWLSNVVDRAATGIYKMGKSLVTDGFEFNSAMEQYAAAFQTLLGVDLKEAEAYVEQLRVFAQETPLGMQGIASGAVSLLNAGFDSGEIINTLSFLGDVALGDQNRLDKIIRAYTQVKSFGRLRAQEAYQFLDADVPLYSILAEYLKVDQSEIAELQKNGAITFDVFDAALRAAVADEGLYYKAMENYMGTFAGQSEKMKDMYEQTAGELMEPFFEVVKSDVFPKLADSLSSFNAWIVENKDSITEFATAIGEFATTGIDGLISGFEWIVNNGENVAAGITAIGMALATTFAKAHPYMTMFATTVAGMQWLASQGKEADAEAEAKKGLTFREYMKNTGDDFLFDDSTYEKLQLYASAKRDYDNAVKSGAGKSELAALKSVMDMQQRQVDPEHGNWFHTGIIDMYNMWAEQTNLDPYNVMLEVDPAAESSLQSEIDGMQLDATVDVYANMAYFYSAMPSYGKKQLAAGLDVAGSAFYALPDGSHAKGLDFVPRDGYLARLHYGEAVLNRSTADMLRNGGGIGSTGRVEALLQDVLVGIRQIAGNTSAGQTLALDTGVLVGQITPQIDKRLGTISNRKGRG